VLTGNGDSRKNIGSCHALEQESPQDIGGIIGITIGVLVAVVFIVLCVWYYYPRAKSYLIEKRISDILDAKNYGFSEESMKEEQAVMKEAERSGEIEVGVPIPQPGPLDRTKRIFNSFVNIAEEAWGEIMRPHESLEEDLILSVKGEYENQGLAPAPLLATELADGQNEDRNKTLVPKIRELVYGQDIYFDENFNIVSKHVWKF